MDNEQMQIPGLEISGQEEQREHSYEEDMKRLEIIAAELERGELGLNDQLARFEEAMALVKRCQKELDRVEERLAKMEKDETETPLDDR
ncbi:MAG TPA: exodeoxyribonuclease VII small subunit [Fastidiosipila sp.]|jgi:exodeoxyribonuclease VII small subunit|nr:exodeoxyribonuclease VII small subunit [Fastidiosipila sp.]